MKGGSVYLAQLNNLIVTGSSRFLNKVYFSNGGTFNGNLNVNNGSLQLYDRVALEGYDSWLRINEPKHFTSGIYCGNGTLRTDGEFQCSVFVCFSGRFLEKMAYFTNILV